MAETQKTIIPFCHDCGHAIALHDMGIGDCDACRCAGFTVVPAPSAVSPEAPDEVPNFVLPGGITTDALLAVERKRRASFGSPEARTPEPTRLVEPRTPLATQAVEALRVIALAGSKAMRSDYVGFISTLDAGELLCEVELVEAARTVLRNAALRSSGGTPGEATPAFCEAEIEAIHAGVLALRESGCDLLAAELEAVKDRAARLRAVSSEAPKPLCGTCVGEGCDSCEGTGYRAAFPVEDARNG